MKNMILFAGLAIGSPVWGAVADRFHHLAWVVMLGSGVSLLILVMLIFLHQLTIVVVSVLFFTLGFFSACQILGFAWLTKNMDPELVGVSSAFNSMIFMSANGGVKQLSGYFLTIAPFFTGHSVGKNIFIFMACAMLLTMIYVVVRNVLFGKQIY